MPKTRFLVDLIERTAATYVEVFLGLLIASGLGTPADRMDLITKAAISAIPAALAVVKGGAAKLRGDPDGASLADLPAIPRLPKI